MKQHRRRINLQATSLQASSLQASNLQAPTERTTGEGGGAGSPRVRSTTNRHPERFVIRGLFMLLLGAPTLVGGCFCGTPVTNPDAPRFDPVQSPTALTNQQVSGTKPASTSITINGTEVVPFDEDTVWAATLTLVEGNNDLIAVAIDGGGRSSEPASTSITADFTPPGPPVVTSNPPAVTDADSLTIEGSKDANSILRLSGVDTEDDAASTTWSVDVSLADGVNNFIFTAADALGNESTPVTVSVIKSNVDLSVDTPPTLTSDDPLTVTGQRGAGVAVRLGGNEILAGGNEGAWSVEVDLAEGANTLVFSGEIGGTVGPDLSFDVELDTAGPGAPTMEAIAAVVVDAALAVQGTKDADTNVVINGSEVFAADSGTTWSANLTLALGVNDLDVFSEDALGNASLSIDPAPTVFYDPSGIVISVDAYPIRVPANPVTLTGTRGADVDVQIDGNVVAAADGSAVWTADVTLVAGTNTLVVTGAAGGAVSAPINVVIDFLPDDPVEPTVNAPSLTNDESVMLSGTKPPGTAIIIDGVVVVPADEETMWSVTITLTEGDNDVSVQTQDEFDRTSVVVVVAVEVDLTGPTVSLDTPLLGQIVNEQVLISGTAIDDNGIADVRVSVDGAEPVSIGTASPFSGSVDTTASTNNGSVIQIDLEVEDLAGSISVTTTDVFLVHTPLAISGGNSFTGPTTSNPDLWVGGARRMAAVFNDASIEGDLDIYLSLQDGLAFASTEADVVLITDENVTLGDSRTAQVAVDDTDLAHVVWLDDGPLAGEAATPGLLHRTYDGTTLSAVALVASGAGANPVNFPDLAASAGGVATVYVQGNRVWLSRLVLGTWTAPLDVSVTGVSDQVAAPRVAVGTDGMVHMIWMDRGDIDGDGLEDADLIYRRFDTVGGLSAAILATEDELGFVDGESSLPAIALVADDANRLAYLSWSEFGAIGGLGSGVPKVALRTLDNSAFDAFPILGEIVNVSGDVTGSVGVVSTQVAADASGSIAVAWVDTGDINGANTGNVGGDLDVFVRRFNGAWETDAQSISDRNSNATSVDLSFQPAIGVDAIGNTHVIWSENSDLAGASSGAGDQDILYFAIGPQGT